MRKTLACQLVAAALLLCGFAVSQSPISWGQVDSPLLQDRFASLGDGTAKCWVVLPELTGLPLSVDVRDFDIHAVGELDLDLKQANSHAFARALAAA